MARTRGGRGKKVPTKRGGNWSEDSLKRAMKAVREGMAVKRASDIYNIPRRTLRNHLASGSELKKLGRQPYLNPDQETELRSRIIRMADIGMPITPKLVKRSVFTFCLENDLPHPFSLHKGLAGRKWFKAFMMRNPDIARRKAQNLNPARAIKLNKWIVNDHFTKLREVMRETGVMAHPQLIFNMDEKGCRLTLHKAPMVLAKKGAKNVHLVAPEHGENVTIVACANALGQAIPPMILFKGQRLKPEWTENLPPGSIAYMTSKGSMTTLVFIEWLKHFAKYKPAGNALLILDGAASHLDANIVDAAEKNNITLYCLPSNTTHALQPLDKSVFRPFEAYWNDEVLAYWENNPERKITKATFGVLFSKVWPKAVTPANVMSGFRGTGIYPFDANAIPLELFAPSEVTEREIQAIDGGAPQSIASANAEEHSFIRQVLEDSEDEDDLNLLHDETSTHGEPSTNAGTDEHGSTPMQSRSSHSPPSTGRTFSQILRTPKITRPVKERKKSLNYVGNKVTRSLFKNQEAAKLGERQKKQVGLKNDSKNLRGTSARAGPSTSTAIEPDSWYCSVCQEDIMEDMIRCKQCEFYVHELCAGIDKTDVIYEYTCPNCET